jgi:hypothetical protein
LYVASIFLPYEFKQARLDEADGEMGDVDADPRSRPSGSLSTAGRGRPR